jgi:hypothetical protein
VNFAERIIFEGLKIFAIRGGIRVDVAVIVNVGRVDGNDRARIAGVVDCLELKHQRAYAADAFSQLGLPCDMTMSLPLPSGLAECASRHVVACCRDSCARECTARCMYRPRDV